MPQPRAHLIWPAPARFEYDESKLDIAAAILGDGLSSRLKKQLVYERQMCTDVYTFNVANEISGMFVVVATIRPDSSLIEVETLIKDEVERLAAATLETAAEITYLPWRNHRRRKEFASINNFWPN